MFIVDAHEDLAYIALHDGQDIRKPTRLSSSSSHGGLMLLEKEGALVSLPDHRRGGVGLIFATLFVLPDSADPYADAQAQLKYYQKLAEEPEAGIKLIQTRGQLSDFLGEWNATAKQEERPIGLVLLMEGADPIREPQEVNEWYDQGLRIIGLSWQKSRYAGGTGNPGPLTAEGRELLKYMYKCGMILDLSHISDDSFWEAIELFQGKIIASHSNCRTHIPGDRHLTDKMIRTIIRRDGVIGTVLLNAFLQPGWTPESNEAVTLDNVVRQIDYVCQIAGNTKHSAIGSDIGAGYATPQELETVADLGKIANALEKRGYKEQHISDIMGGNWLRLLKEALPEQRT